MRPNPAAGDTPGDGKVRFAGLLTPAEQQSAIGVFTKPQDKLEETFQASWFDTTSKAGCAALLRFKINRFMEGEQMEVRENLIRDTQAAMCSVEGRSFKFSIMGIVQVLFPHWLGWKGKEWTSGLNRFKKHDQQGQEPNKE
jgi:hypothetical protein